MFHPNSGVVLSEGIRTVAVAARTEKSQRVRDDEKRLELHEHLGELRSRILRSIFYICVGGIICYFYFQPIYAFLFNPMAVALRKYPDARIVFMHFTQPFMVVLQISLAAGLIVSAPFVTLEMWAFIAPALTKDEKRPIKYVAPIGIVLFAMGVSLAYWVARFTVGWFLGFVNLFPNAVLYQDPKAYVLFMLKLMAVFGAIFQLPVILMFLAWIGVMRSSWMKKYWRHAIVGISVAGLMVAPSNDTLTIFVMVGPVFVLYFLSIFLVQIIERKRDRRAK